MYEPRHQRPLSRRHFLLRLWRHVAAAAALVVMSLLAGMWGYAHFENLEWHDGFLDSAMLLGGMGPVHPPQTPAGKLFAGLYALYAGLLFIVTASVVLAPIIHRLLHQFHWEDGAGTPKKGR